MPEPKKAKYPKVADFIYNLPGMGKYFKTNVPGESELISRLLGIDPKYDYMNVVNPVDEIFEIVKGPITKDTEKLWAIYKDKSWQQVGNKKYKPSESPITETKPGVFEANPKTQFGKNLQRRIDLAFIKSKLIEKDYNPDKNIEKCEKEKKSY